MNSEYNTITEEDLQKFGKSLLIVLGLGLSALVKAGVDVYDAHEKSIDIEAVSVGPPSLTTAELGVVKSNHEAELHRYADQDWFST